MVSQYLGSVLTVAALVMAIVFLVSPETAEACEMWCGNVGSYYFCFVEGESGPILCDGANPCVC